MKNKILFSSFSILLFSFLVNHQTFAATTAPTTSSNTTSSSTNPLINLTVGQSGNLSSSVEIFIIITLLSFLPAIIISLTCYTKIAVVLSLTRQALGTMSAPPNQVISGLALIITMFIMAPIGTQIYQNALLPYQDGRVTFQQAVNTAEQPLKKYMLNNVKDKDLEMMEKVAKVDVKKKQDIPFLVVATANLISQLHDALGMGAIIMSAFVVIDMIVATILMLLGMFMLPPNTISLPIKIITFLAAGGFQLIIEILVQSIKV